MITALAYNTREGFADIHRRDQLLDLVEQVNPTIAFFSESHWDRDREGHVLAVSEALLESMGYVAIVGSDNDTSSRPDKSGFIGLVHMERGGAETLDLGIRQGFHGTLTDAESGLQVGFGGAHFTDHHESERLEQVGLIPLDVDVFMGDLNAMHRKAWLARVLRAFELPTHLIPDSQEDFNETNLKNGLSLVRKYLHLAKRAVGIAEGHTLDQLSNMHALMDTDPRQRRTVGPFQLDYILATPDFKASNFQVHRDVKLSDHKPISVDLRLAV